MYPSAWLFPILFAASLPSFAQVSAPHSGPLRRAPDRVVRPPILYVDVQATGSPEGTSWTDAFTGLQDALAVARPGQEIWVAKGTYLPVPIGGPTNVAFQIPARVRLYGGFDGTETLRSQRDPVSNPTILSGAVGGVGSPFGRSQHVLRLDNVDGVRIDGFEIQFGQATFGAFQDVAGGGLFVSSSTAIVADCTFTACEADRGGAIGISDSDLTLSRCAFVGNQARSFVASGGAIHASGASTVRVEDSRFEGNDAVGLGGWALGGALRSEAGTELLLERCALQSNTALSSSTGGVDFSRGGAVFCEGRTTLIHSTFTSNVSNVAGALQSFALAPNWTRVYDCLFAWNEAVPGFVNSIQFDGAAGAIAGGVETDLIGTLVYGGHADNFGGAVVGGRVSGCIFWANTDGNGSIGTSNISASGPVEYSCVQNMLVVPPGEDPPDPAEFPGSIDLDPAFVDAPAGDFHLLAGSPCIDAADNTARPPDVFMDLDLRPRYADDPATPDTGLGPPPIVDMGPLEFIP